MSENKWNKNTKKIYEIIEESQAELNKQKFEIIDNVSEELLKSKSLSEIRNADQHKINSVFSEAYLANLLSHKTSAKINFEKELENGKDTDLYIPTINTYIEVIKPKMEAAFQSVEKDEIITTDGLDKGYTPKTIVGDKTKIQNIDSNNMYFVGVDVSHNISNVVIDALILQDEENLQVMVPKKYDVIDGIIIYNSEVRDLHNPDVVLISKDTDEVNNFADKLGMKKPDCVPTYIERENRVLYKYDNENISPNRCRTIFMDQEENGWYISQTKSSFSRTKKDSLINALDKSKEIRRYQSNLYGNEPIKIRNKSGTIHSIIIDLDRWRNNIENNPIPPWIKSNL